MENNSYYIPSYANCSDPKLSNYSITADYWDATDIKSGPRIVSTVTASILLLFLVVGLPSNVILIISIISKNFKRPTYILLLNLAISDLLVCALVFPFGIVSGYAGSFVFGNNDRERCYVCQFGLIYTTLSVASLNILGLISIDRFVYFRYPLSYPRYITATKTVFVTILVWLFAVLQSILPLFGIGAIRYSYSASLCLVRIYGSTQTTKNVYYFCLLVLLGLFPVITVVVTNVWILNMARLQINKLYKTMRTFGNNQELQNHQQNLRKEITNAKNKKELVLFRIFGIIFIANVVTWVPAIIQAVLSMGMIYSVPYYFYSIVILTFFSHSILHPIIEGCFIPELKKEFRKILCPCKKRDRSSIYGDAVDDDSRSFSHVRCLDVCSFALLSGSQDVIDTSITHTSASN